jgi:hypothetical protein
MKTAQKVSLTHNMRIKNRSGDDAEAAAEWQKLLEEIGNGTHEKIKGSYEDLLEIPKAMLSDASNMKDFVLSCYGNMRKHTEDLGWLGKRMIITNKNDYVDKLNNIALNLMPGKEIVLSSIDTCDTDNELFGPEVLKYHNPSGIPPHFLKLKKNCIVTLMRNLDPASGLCNGTRIMITDISYRVLIGKIIGCEKFEGKIVAIPRIMTVDSNTNAVFTLHRKQFPVRLAFCMTVHKVQGQTLENVFYYLNSHPFSHGQIFVAFSRVGLLRDIKVFADYSEAKEVRGKICIRNVVWKEVLDLD